MIDWREAKNKHKVLKSRWSEESGLTQKIVIGILRELQEGREEAQKLSKELRRIGTKLGNLDELQGFVLAYKEKEGLTNQEKK